MEGVREPTWPQQPQVQEGGKAMVKGQETGRLGSFQAPYSNSWEVKPVWKERREGGKLALIFVRTKCWELPAVLFLFFVFVGGGS